MTRLFVALEPPPQVRQHLDAAVAPVRALAPGLRWVPTDRWHLTLAFLGELDDARIDPLGVRLARAATRHATMELTVGAAGKFGSGVLWAGITGDAATLGALSHLAASAGAAGRREGADVDDQPYRPHLTLARSRARGGHADLRPLVEALRGYVGPTWTADTLHLVASHLGPTPAYGIVGSWPLRGGG